MQVKITFEPWKDSEDEDLIYLFILTLEGRIDELLYRTPDNVLRGKHKITLTYYGLSKREAQIIYKTVQAEKIEDGLIRRVMIINSRSEEDTGAFQFAQPEYKEGVKEDLESKKGYGVDIQKFVGGAIISVIKHTATLDLDDFKDATAPLTTLAIYQYEALEYLLESRDPEDQEDIDTILTYRMVDEPMYKESRRKPRPKKKKSIAWVFKPKKKKRRIIPKRII